MSSGGDGKGRRWRRATGGGTQCGAHPRRCAPNRQRNTCTAPLEGRRAPQRPLTRRALLLVLQGRRAPSELPADSLGRLPERHGRSLLAAGRRAGARSSAGAAEGLGDERS